MDFDPNAAAANPTNLYGLPDNREQALFHVLPVPFDATASFGKGTADGPARTLEASQQVDLYDHRFGRVYEAGVCLHAEPETARPLNEQATRLTGPIIDLGGPQSTQHHADALRVTEMQRDLLDGVEDWVRSRLSARRLPILLGGEHSLSVASVRAVAERCPRLGVLQIDAHMDYRDAFEGFTHSHASVTREIARLGGVERIVHAGIRDYCEEELDFARSLGDRSRVFFDADLASRLLAGEPYHAWCDEIVASLPEKVYISFDIDGLDPTLCPATGTPVPGGLGFEQASVLLQTLAQSGREIVGFDLVEIGDAAWDANVAARVLYRLMGATLRSRSGVKTASRPG